MNKVADKLLDIVMNALFNSSGGGGILGMLGSLFGDGTSAFVPGIMSGSLVGLFANGGHVRGPGTSTSDSIPARLSNGEFVVNARATARNRALLEAVNDNRLPGFADGGLVGGGAPVFAGNDNRAQQIAINAPITVNGSAGTPEQNTDLSKKMARQLESTMRGVVADELRRSTRPGNPLSRRR
ncbi:MAG: hypothetical protein EOS07_24690 [Mesorhizobium sp.]|nr:MAG: hypothetical protein EOS07_24690 [Mesorhizobium sp.]